MEHVIPGRQYVICYKCVTKVRVYYNNTFFFSQPRDMVYKYY